MPAPRFIAHFNRLVTNRLLSGIARVLPGFGVVQHRGRKSGRLYQSPVCVFRYGSLYTIALTYGPQSDWVRNVLAGDGCMLLTQGRNQKLSSPYLLCDSERRSVPLFIARLLGLMRVDYFLELRAT